MKNPEKLVIIMFQLYYRTKNLTIFLKHIKSNGYQKQLFVPILIISVYTDPILVFFGTEIAYAPKQFFSARLRGFSGQKRMIFPGRTVRQKTCRIKPKLDQYIINFCPVVSVSTLVLWHKNCLNRQAKALGTGLWESVPIFEKTKVETLYRLRIGSGWVQPDNPAQDQIILFMERADRNAEHFQVSEKWINEKYRRQS